MCGGIGGGGCVVAVTIGIGRLKLHRAQQKQNHKPQTITHTPIQTLSHLSFKGYAAVK